MKQTKAGDYFLEFVRVGPNGTMVDPPEGYFFLSSAPCGEALRVLVTWRKSRGENDPGPAPPVTAAPILHRLPKKKAGRRGAKR